MGKNSKKKLGSRKVRKIVEEQVICLNSGKQNAEHEKNSNKRKIASDFKDISTHIMKNKKLKRNRKPNEENANIDSVQLNEETIKKGSSRSKTKINKEAKLSLVTTTGSSDVDGNDGSNELKSNIVEEVESSTSVPKQNKRKKKKKEPNQGNDIDCEVVQIQPNKSKTQLIIGKEQMSTENENKKSNKIRFIDNVPVEVAPDAKKQKVQKQNMNDEETLITEEEIDRFCDDIDDEDNEQYEDWVKLLEAKLGNNKNKNK